MGHGRGGAYLLHGCVWQVATFLSLYIMCLLFAFINHAPQQSLENICLDDFCFPCRFTTIGLCGGMAVCGGTAVWRDSCVEGWLCVEG